MGNVIEFENRLKCGQEFDVSEGSRRNPKERWEFNASAVAKAMAGREGAKKQRRRVVAQFRLEFRL